MKNVSEVDREGLCLECGACAGLCPHHNVRLSQDSSGRYRVRVQEDAICESCSGICLKVCPGHEVNEDQLNLDVFGSLPDNMPAGHYRQAYLGYTSDPEVLEQGASGGIVSAILIQAFESGLLQGAYLLQDVPGQPFVSVPRLVTGRAGVIASAGSRYWPAPVAQTLGEILAGEGRFAFVGLPCQIQAVRKAQRVYKKLKQKIAFCIGLYCGGRPTILGQRFALRKYGVQPDRVAAVRYRQGPWPGRLAITLKDGSTRCVPKSEQLPGYGSHLFCHPRCLFCHDALANLADISTGDALRLDGVREPPETSLLIARTPAGEQLLASASASGAIHLRTVQIDLVVHAQKRPILHKRRALWARLQAARWLGLPVPTVTVNHPAPPDPTASDYLAGLTVLIINRLVSTLSGQALLRLIPLKWLRNYNIFSRFS